MDFAYYGLLVSTQGVTNLFDPGFEETPWLDVNFIRGLCINLVVMIFFSVGNLDRKGAGYCIADREGSGIGA